MRLQVSLSQFFCGSIASHFFCGSVPLLPFSRVAGFPYFLNWQLVRQFLLVLPLAEPSNNRQIFLQMAADVVFLVHGCALSVFFVDFFQFCYRNSV